jgi:hypothetical protein
VNAHADKKAKSMQTMHEAFSFEAFSSEAFSSEAFSYCMYTCMPTSPKKAYSMPAMLIVAIMGLQAQRFS